MHKLTFKSSESLKTLARETLKAESFRIAYENKTTEEKSFFLVKDRGIYLMNAFETNNGKSPTENGYTVYAQRYNPKYDLKGDLWDRTYEVSPDDFAFNLYLTNSQLENLAKGGDLSVNLGEDYYETRV